MSAIAVQRCSVRLLWCLSLATSVWTVNAAWPAARAFALDVRRPDVTEFISRMASKNGFDERDLQKLFSAAQSQPAIIDAMNRPAEKEKTWFEYRAIFITDNRIRAGTEFWLAHRDELEQAAAQTGVAAEYIVGVLGVETLFGKQTGHYRVIDSLSTLAFDYPPRSKFFAGELEQFLLLTREAGVDPLSAMGSYAGAMGAPQFMPSSYRLFGVDASHDGHIDLWANWLDVFCSVGNYFKEHGWVSDEPVLSEAQVDPSHMQDLDGRSVSLSDTLDSLRARGVNVQTTQPGDTPAMLVAADYPDGIHWRVGYNNFYVITRYNHSPLYAMAVTELADAVKAAVDSQPAVPPQAPLPNAPMPVPVAPSPDAPMQLNPAAS